MPEQVLKITKRVIIGQKTVLEPDLKKAIPLPDKRLTKSTVERIVKRNCGVVMDKVEFEKSLTEKKGEQ